MKQKTYRVSATVRIDCEMDVVADSEDEALEQASQRSGDEWMSWDIMGEMVDDVEVIGIKREPRKSCKPQKP